MAVPPEFRAALMAEIAATLPGMITRAWAAVQRASKVPTAAPPKKKTPEGRVARGRARQAIYQSIKAHEEEGASRDDIRRMAPTWLGGRPLSENTLKRVLMDLREKEQIETRNSKWYATRQPIRTERMTRSMIFDKKDDE